jgi:integrase
VQAQQVNWRSLRTSHAVWLKMAGADVKDAQGQMRHSRASTTLDIYQMSKHGPNHLEQIERLKKEAIGK